MSKKVKKTYFPTQDCIHLRACRRINAIANKHLYGTKGTQKMSRGCNTDCSCYQSYEELDEIIGNIDEDVYNDIKDFFDDDRF